MAVRATLNVTTGPDRGKSFDLTEPLTHIGSGAESQVLLSDPGVASHQASIASRDGRFFIYTPPAAEIEVDGNKIPPEQRVWLPDEATIQVSRRTSLHFVCTGGSGNGDADDGAPAAVLEVPPPETQSPDVAQKPAAPKVKRPADGGSDSIADLARVQREGAGGTEKQPEKKEKKRPKVAKFITDSPGNMLVKLGDDGHLPELMLEEGEARAASETQAKQSNPLLLIAAFCFSLGMTALLLFMDAEGFGTGGGDVAEANRKIAEYYGAEGEEIKPYQAYLRLARQAHSRRDYQAERREYRKVLDLLRAEGKSKFTGLTGSLDRDKELEDKIAILLNQ